MRYFKIVLVVTALAAAVLAASAVLSRARGSTLDTHILFFPNDFGRDSVNVSQYPPRMKRYYKLFLAKCSVCHTIARPLNAQFLELTPAEMQRAKEGQPDLFRAGTDVIQPGPKAWSHIVHRMMSKPGASISRRNGRKIWAFLVYDSTIRKTGKNLGPWESWRQNLLAHFERLYPKMYHRLLKKGELKAEVFVSSSASN
jgi:hypothetical protein